MAVARTFLAQRTAVLWHRCWATGAASAWLRCLILHHAKGCRLRPTFALRVLDACSWCSDVDDEDDETTVKDEAAVAASHAAAGEPGVTTVDKAAEVGAQQPLVQVAAGTADSPQQDAPPPEMDLEVGGGVGGNASVRLMHGLMRGHESIRRFV